MNPRNLLDSRVPAARTLDLVTTESKDEVLVYDQAVHHIHHLNAIAATVWRLCDGERTVSEIATEAEISEDTVKLALRTLEGAQLLEGDLASHMRGTHTRRSFMKRAGIAAIPAVISITAPIAKAAASGGTIACEGGGNSCCEGPCNGTNGKNWSANNGDMSFAPYLCVKKDKPEC